MSEEANRRKNNLQKKLKKAIDNIIDGAKNLASANKLNPLKKKGNISSEAIINAGAELEAEKKAEQIAEFLEEEVFKKIEILESRIQELENGLSAVSSTTTPGL